MCIRMGFRFYNTSNPFFLPKIYNHTSSYCCHNYQTSSYTSCLISSLKSSKNPQKPYFVLMILEAAALRKAGKNRVKAYCLISPHSTIKQKRKHIYVHSKIMIVDDRWITIGSANTDRDGFKDSTEFNLGMTSTTLAKQLRAKLLHEHLKEYISSSNNNINMYDFDKGFEAWEKVANDNGKRVQKGESIEGHIYYYNFEEMNFPPHYDGAKGGN
jgi:phosphatidylserine/phosphatidylglycerophosphate/cardiolipin synthase-like enzyme